MTTYTVSSKAARKAYELAEDQIRSDLSVGAVEAYIDGDSAIEYLGQLIAIHQGTSGNAVIVDTKVGDRLQYIVDRLVELNVEKVAEENAR